MPRNNYVFRFKQFEVKQEKSAMKICTDSCVFGAVINLYNSEKILDIGTGTGLLALMLAQKSFAQIHAIEIDSDAAEEAKLNFYNSRWSKRLKLIHSSVQEFASISETKYDFIISNPPFFFDNLKSSTDKRNTAMHSENLTQDEFVSAVNKLLTKSGKLAVMLPPFETALLNTKLRPERLFPEKVFLLKNDLQSKPIREITIYSKSETKEIFISEIIIRDEKNNYTAQFREFLKDYYLIF